MYQTSRDTYMIEENLIQKIREIGLLISDVDGVMTDGSIIMDDMGHEIKKFNVRDGHGIKLLMRYGIDVILLTGRQSKVVEYRAKDLGIVEVHQGVFNKMDTFEEIIRSRGIACERVSFIGDDIVDIPVLRKVGFSVAVADAHEDVKRSVDYITASKGGGGAVREVCEIILRHQDKWGEVAQKYDIP